MDKKELQKQKNDLDYFIGLCYAKGKEGLEQNYEKAAKNYKKAAQRGNIFAMNNLAGLYFYGKGVIMNKGFAEKLWIISAEGGCIEAMKNISELYKEISLNMSEYWSRLAEKQKKE